VELGVAWNRVEIGLINRSIQNAYLRQRDGPSGICCLFADSQIVGPVHTGLYSANLKMEAAGALQASILCNIHIHGRANVTSAAKKPPLDRAAIRAVQS
jgi:hypothetical protein